MNVSCPDCRSIFRVDPAKVPPNGVRARCSVCSGVISIPAPGGLATPSEGSARTATPPTPVERQRPTPPAQSGWDSSPQGTPSHQVAPAAPIQRPTPAAPPPPPPPRAEAPAPRREGPLDRGPVVATATPPSPATGLPEFGQQPTARPFTPPPFTPPTPPASTPPATGNTGAAAPYVPPAPAARPPQPSAPTPPRPPVTPPGASPAVGDAGARRPLNPFLSKDPNQRAKRLARALVSDIITYHPAKHAEGLRDGTLKQLFREEIKKSFEEYIAQVGQQLAENTTYFQEALNEVLAGGRKIF